MRLFINKLFIKIEKPFFYLLIFSIPFQTRKILWQQEWYFNEWQTISLYGTDILLSILILFWLFNFKSLNIKRYDLFLFAFAGISAVSIQNSTSLYISMYSLVKLAEFLIFYFYLKSYAIPKFGYRSVLLGAVAGGSFQAVVAILQFLKQSELGLKLLGETIVSNRLSGIASFYNLAGEWVIRSYGTSPHPNILATYLFLSVFSFYYLWIYGKLDKKLLIAYALMLLALFFTFSRVVIAVLFLNLGIRIFLIRYKFKRDYWNNKLALLFLVSFIVISMFLVFYWSEVASRLTIHADDAAVQMRIFYNKESLKSFNWFGVGIGNSVNWLMGQNLNLARYLYQPTHNIYLLIFSEVSIFGFLSFILFLVFLVRDYINRTKLKTLKQYSLLLIFLSFLFLGLFDHFLWTLQQGRFIFWGVIALLASDVV